MRCRWFYFGPNSVQPTAKKTATFQGRNSRPDGFSGYFRESRQESTAIFASGVS